MLGVHGQGIDSVCHVGKVEARRGGAEEEGAMDEEQAVG